MKPRFAGPLAAAMLLTLGACGLGVLGTQALPVDASVPALDAGTPPEASARDDAAGGDAAGGESGTVTADGGSDPDSGGPGGTLLSLPCGSATCALPAEVCCIYRDNAGKFSFACAVAACPPVAGSDVRTFTCSGAANCPANTRCCMIGRGSDVFDSQCLATCPEAQFCDPGVADAGCDGQVCAGNNIGTWKLPKVYATCGDKSE